MFSLNDVTRWTEQILRHLPPIQANISEDYNVMINFRKENPLWSPVLREICIKERIDVEFSKERTFDEIRSGKEEEFALHIALKSK